MTMNNIIKESKILSDQLSTSIKLKRVKGERERAKQIIKETQNLKRFICKDLLKRNSTKIYLRHLNQLSMIFEYLFANVLLT